MFNSIHVQLLQARLMQLESRVAEQAEQLEKQAQALTDVKALQNQMQELVQLFESYTQDIQGTPGTQDRVRRRRRADVARQPPPPTPPPL